jgi:3-methyladenine DNA glycosylase/8-oxoguanine DNA glycosylase
VKRILKMDKKNSIEIRPKAPFNFDATVFKPDHFPTPDHVWEPGKYWQTMRIDSKIVGFKLENKGTIKNPKIKVSLYAKGKLSKKEIEKALEKISWQFGFDEDLSEFYEKFKNDKILSPLFKKYLGMRVNSGEIGLYTMLQVYVVLQNATIRRTVQMMNNLLEKYGQKVKFDGKEMYVFWTPEILNKASEKELRNLKLGYRARFLKKIAKDFVKGKIKEEIIKKLPTKEAKKELLKIYGIGPASVDYILFEVFHRYDAFDYLPPWDQKILSRLIYNKPLVPVKKILKDAQNRWGEWKRLAIHYIWEDIFWQRKGSKKIPWLEKEIRL